MNTKQNKESAKGKEGKEEGREDRETGGRRGQLLRPPVPLFSCPFSFLPSLTRGKSFAIIVLLINKSLTNNRVIEGSFII